MKGLLEKVIRKENLTSSEARTLMEALMGGELSPPVMAAFLVALRMKGETAEEITVFAQVMREKATPIAADYAQVVDTCGTGGDASGSINISTTVALLMAGAGHKVAKHGNRSMTSRSGSADVLEALGVKIDLTPQQVGQCIDQAGIGFLFAPALHSAMRHVVPVRKELGVRTLFNLLGPLTNPAGANVQVLGLFDPQLVGVMARVLKGLGVQSGFVVSGVSGFDEVALSENTLVAHLAPNGEIEEFEFDPEMFGYEKVPLTEIAGGSAAENAVTCREILGGALRGPKREVVALNAGFVLAAAEGLNFKEAFQRAEALLGEQVGLQALERLIQVSNGFA